MEPIDAERNLLLDHLEATGTPITTRGALEVVVLPLARQLRTRKAGGTSGSPPSSSTTRSS